MAPRPESLQSAIPNPARIRKWKCVSKRRIHRSEICIEPRDGESFGRRKRMDANPIGKKGGRVAAMEQPKGNVQNRKPKLRRVRTAKDKGWNASQETEPVGLGKDRGSGNPETQFAEDTPMG